MTDGSKPSSAEDPLLPADRTKFLLTMYEEAWDNINRHLLLIWQPVAALLAALVAMFLREAKNLSPDLAATLGVVAAGWVIAHSLDASSWVNRNLALVRNIEREFLRSDDERLVQHFFAEGHRSGSPVEHFQIQMLLAASVWCLILLDHLCFQLRPASGPHRSIMSFPACLPYAASFVFLSFLLILACHYGDRYRQLVERSPGRITLR